AQRFVASGLAEMQIATGRAYDCIDPPTFEAEDLEIVGSLLSSSNSVVVESAFRIARRIAGKDQQLALALLQRVDFRASVELAEEVLAIINHTIPFEKLSRDIVQ